MDAQTRADFEEQVRAALVPHLAPALRPQAAQLARFCAALAATNENINLTGITDPQGMAVRHVLDSLTVAPLLDGCRTLMDFGSGGGVPGIPLALARPELSVVLVESRERKAAALAGLVRELSLGPRVSVAHARGEQWLAEHTVDAVVARAVSETAEMLESLRKVRGHFRRLILMKGPAADDELATAGKRYQRLGFSAPSGTRSRCPVVRVSASCSFLPLEPGMGFEPTTSALRKPCSTTELPRPGRRQRWGTLANAARAP